MASSPASDFDVRAAVESAARDLLRVKHWADVSFVSLPLIGPDGSPITVRISRDMAGFRVDDAGRTFQAFDRLGLGRSFSGIAPHVVDDDSVAVSDHSLVSFADEGSLEAAIMDVGLASWSIYNRHYEKADDIGEEALEERLRDRLAAIFGSGLDSKQTIDGSSTTHWTVSAVLHVDNRLAVFQAVSDGGNSLYRASAIFHDLASLAKPPSLVAVVRDKEELGSKLGLLSQVARVIESGQPDEVYKRAAA